MYLLLRLSLDFDIYRTRIFTNFVKQAWEYLRIIYLDFVFGFAFVVLSYKQNYFQNLNQTYTKK